MQVDRFGDGAALRAQDDNPPEILRERRAHLLAKAIKECRQPHPKVESELFWRAVDLIHASK